MVVAALLLPVSVFALNFPPPAANFGVIPFIDALISVVFYIVVGLSVVMFIVAGFMFITAQGEPGKIKLAREAVIWGAVGVGIALLSTTIPWLVNSFLGG